MNINCPYNRTNSINIQWGPFHTFLVLTFWWHWSRVGWAMSCHPSIWPDQWSSPGPGWTSMSSVTSQVSANLRLSRNNCLCNWEGNKVSSRCEIDFDLICLATALLSTASCWWLCPDDNGRYLPGDWITGPSGTSLYNTPATQWRQPAPITSCWLKQAPLWIIHLFPHLKLVWFHWIFCATSYNVV